MCKDLGYFRLFMLIIKRCKFILVGVGFFFRVMLFVIGLIRNKFLLFLFTIVYLSLAFILVLIFIVKIFVITELGMVERGINLKEVLDGGEMIIGLLLLIFMILIVIFVVEE